MLKQLSKDAGGEGRRLMNCDRYTDEDRRDYNAAAGHTYSSKFSKLQLKWKEENAESRALLLSKTSRHVGVQTKW